MGLITDVRVGALPIRLQAMIGDSTLNQDGLGKDRIYAKLFPKGWQAAQLSFYAVSGKALEQPDANGYSVADNIAQARALFGREPEWMINLGGNLSGSSNSTITLQMTSTLDNLTQFGAKVNWIGLSQLAGSSVEAQRLNFNSVAKPLVEARPRCVWWDWNAFLRAIPDDSTYWQSDAVHMTTLGYDVKNNYYSNVIGNP